MVERVISAGAGITAVGTDFLAGSAVFTALVATAAAHKGITGFARQRITFASACSGWTFGATPMFNGIARYMSQPITRLTFAGTVPTAVAVLRAAGRVFAAHTLSFGSVRAVYLFALAVFQRIAGCASRTSVRIGTLCAVCGAITAFCAVACRYRIVFVLTAAACRIGRIRRCAMRTCGCVAFAAWTVLHTARDAVVAVDGCCRFVTVVAFTFVACAVRSRCPFERRISLRTRGFIALFGACFRCGRGCVASPAGLTAVAFTVHEITVRTAVWQDVFSAAVAVSDRADFQTVVGA